MRAIYSSSGTSLVLCRLLSQLPENAQLEILNSISKKKLFCIRNKSKPCIRCRSGEREICLCVLTDLRG